MSNLPSTTRLSRTSDGWVAGVCAGLAHRFGFKPWQVRAAFVISCVLPGPQFLVYIALWILMPKQSGY